MNALVANESALDQSVILEAIGVSMVFPGTVALDNADFVVRKSAVTALVGENGAGKSTLMKILAGVNSPTSGELRMNGETVVFNSVHDASAKGIGIVFQELNLCPNLSVTENIFLGRDITRAGLVAALCTVGVQNVALASPAADIEITSQQASWCTGHAVVIGGYDE